MDLNIVTGRHSAYSPQMYNFLKYFQSTKQSICLIHSHINPIILLVVLRPFRAVVKTLYIYLFKSHQNGFGFINEKKAGQSFRGNPNRARKLPLKHETTAILQKVVSIILLIIGTLVIFLVASWVILNITFSDLKNRQLELNDLEEKIVYKRALILLQFSELYLDVSYKYKKLCAEKHGQLHFHFMRCYFLTQHGGYENRTMDLFIPFFVEVILLKRRLSIEPF